MLGAVPNVGTSNAFGFDPSTMSAFSFNFAPPVIQGSPVGNTFPTNMSAFDFTQPTFGSMALGTQPEAVGFAQVGTASSLYDLASHPALPLETQSSNFLQPSSTFPPTPDPFSSLSIDDIKRGFSAPSSAQTLAPVALSPIVPSTLPPTASIHSPEVPVKPGLEETSTFSGSSSNTSEASLFRVETHKEFPKPQQVKSDVNPKLAPKTPERPAKSAEELLAAIDLSKPSTPLTPNPTPNAPSTPYSNANMVKSTIDWSKQRDLMASFLTPSDAPKQSDTSPKKNVKVNDGDNWSRYGDTTAGGDDWSSFGDSTSTHAHPSSNPMETTSTMPFPSIQPTLEKKDAHSTPKSTGESAPLDHVSITAPLSSDAASLALDASKWNADIGHNSFGFDTSAFNFSENPIDFKPDPSLSFPVTMISPTPSSSSLPISEIKPIEKMQSEAVVPFPHPYDLPSSSTPLSSSVSSTINSSTDINSTLSSHVTAKTSEHDLFVTSGFPSSSSPSLASGVEFGGFTSETSDVGSWSAFPGATTTESGHGAVSSLTMPSRDATPPRSSSPHMNVTSTLEPAPSPGRKKPENGVLDLSHFQLPAMPVTPSTPSGTSAVPVSDHRHQHQRTNSNTSSVDVVQSSTPTSASLIDDVVPHHASSSLATSYSNDFTSFSGASTPIVDIFATSTPVSEIPSWMQSNQSSDSGSSQDVASIDRSPANDVNWKDQPTMDELKRRLVEILGTDKAAPYMWIFDNMGKHIMIGFEERHLLAVGLIEDMKSGKVIWLSSSRVNQWHSVLTHCNEDLQRALSYLSNVAVQADLHSEEIMKSYLLHEKTVAYFSSLAKIKKIASRILASALHSNSSNAMGVAGTSSKGGQTPSTTCCYLKPSVLKAIRALEKAIDNSWDAIVTQVKEMHQSCGEAEGQSFAALTSISDPVPHAPISFNCFLCYRGFDEQEKPTQWQEKSYHASCANYWTHCISSKPPSL